MSHGLYTSYNLGKSLLPVRLLARRLILGDTPLQKTSQEITPYVNSTLYNTNQYIKSKHLRRRISCAGGGVFSVGGYLQGSCLQGGISGYPDACLVK